MSSGDLAPDVIHISLLGGLRVRVGTTVLGPRQLGGVKPRHLLIALALARGFPVSKERLVPILWDGLRPVDCTATIETYVCVLRKHLQTSSATRGGGHIETRAGCYSLDLSRVQLDIADAARDIGRALHPSVSPEAALPLLREALTVAAAPLLPDEAGARWLDDAREEHERMNREWLVAAAEKVVLIAPNDAGRWARRAIDTDPLDESAWCAYLVSKEVAGQHAEGLRAYDSCRRLFAEELGCAPGPRLQQIYGRLLGDARDRDQDLEHLIQAVIRLHRAAREDAAADQPFGTGPTGQRAPSWPGPSVEQARRTLSALLRGPGAAQPRLIRSASA